MAYKSKNWPALSHEQYFLKHHFLDVCRYDFKIWKALSFKLQFLKIIEILSVETVPNSSLNMGTEMFITCLTESLTRLIRHCSSFLPPFTVSFFSKCFLHTSCCWIGIANLWQTKSSYFSNELFQSRRYFLLSNAILHDAVLQHNNVWVNKNGNKQKPELFFVCELLFNFFRACSLMSRSFKMSSVNQIARLDWRFICKSSMVNDLKIILYLIIHF